VANERQAEVIHAYDGTEAVRLAPTSSFANRFRVRTPVRDYGAITLPLAGDHQVDNAVVAIRLLEALQARGVSLRPESIGEGLAHVSWPARLELRRLPDGREILLDAAHNADGAAALASFLQANDFAGQPVVFAAMRDKDIPAMLAALAPVAGRFIFTRASTARAADPEEIARHARRIAPGVPCSIAPQPADALEAAWRQSRRIVAAGSIFLLGDVLKELAEA
jgi:dihydrofolate synthase/folylpolyglutamate synthase